MTKIASMTGIARGTVIGKRDGVQPTDEAEHVFKFEMCGDWFDMRDLRAVLDHGRAPAPSPAIATGCYWREVPRFSVVPASHEHTAAGIAPTIPKLRI